MIRLKRGRNGEGRQVVCLTGLAACRLLEAVKLGEA